MVQNMRACFILYVIAIKCMNCIQEKTEVSCMLQRPRLISTTMLSDLSLATKIKQQKNNNKNSQENSQGWQKDGVLLPKGGNCHPIATGLVKRQYNEFLQGNVLGPGLFDQLLLPIKRRLEKNFFRWANL